MRIIGIQDLKAWKASYLAQRFDISIEQARALKEGGSIEVSPEIGNKIIGEGFGYLAPVESEE